MRPDVQHIAITFADDSVGVMAFVTREYDGDSVRWSREASDDNIAAEIAKTSFDSEKRPIKRWQRIDTADIPTDRAFRNAWVHDGSFKMDMPKAREIHRNVLRELRAPKLSALDTAYLRADEAGNKAEKNRIAARKQALRDATDDPRIDAARTPDELKAVIPDAIKD